MEPGEFGVESPDAFAELVAWLPSSDAPEELMDPINTAALEWRAQTYLPYLKL